MTWKRAAKHLWALLQDQRRLNARLVERIRLLHAEQANARKAAE